ncbi:polysaccharide biosynthesis/export family protein [Neorhizobium sp. NCHU2750]|uniref:polysaccharide biosynthesis/export family protein n=1 Tax=Neorhizobium sp. NCHU2750 TaxID=1825976 RepID=UPI000E70C7F7|nr:exopolysaccharide production protein [Neorhizobium sp. NCHU2750]
MDIRPVLSRGFPTLAIAAGTVVLSLATSAIAEDAVKSGSQTKTSKPVQQAQAATTAQPPAPATTPAPATSATAAPAPVPAVTASSSPSTTKGKDGAYRLGVMDKLKIRVAEWQPADGSIRDWDAVSGDYMVGPSGALSLPFIGDLEAAGKTTSEVGEAIGKELQSKFALRNLPSASVEISEFRPVFLAGDVDKPGEYAYSPNLTVLKAISLAGGLRKSDAGQRFARDFINAKGDAQVNESSRGRLLVKRARLMAEIANSPEIAMPEEIKALPNARELMASEAALMKSRRQRYDLQLKALDDLKTLLNTEIQSLAQKSTTQQRQMQLFNDDRDRMAKLSEQGLATSSRRLSAEERASDLESNMLDTDTASLRAKQDVTKANQDEINLRNDWDAQCAQDLQDTEAQLEKLDLQLSTNRALMSEALAQSAEALKFDPSAKDASIKYMIVRDTGDGPKQIPVDENAMLRPGDVIKVSSELLMQ